MSQLIQMRQRLKAVETIRKITHAMQLVSMSTHLRLRTKKTNAENYQDALKNVFIQALSQFSEWNNPILQPPSTMPEKKLILLIGSQKGLCGTFNLSLLNSLETVINEKKCKNADLIVIGQKIAEYVTIKSKSFPLKLKKIYSELSQKTITKIVSELSDLILMSPTYTSVIIYSNYPATFFLQRHELVTLIPFIIPKDSPTDLTNETLHWEDDPQVIIDSLANHYIRATLNATLTKSLLAEQAARFISMDSATRNAKSLLETMQLQYNKVRQAKITKELTELTGSF